MFLKKDITDITNMPKQFHITINYWLNRKKEEEYIAIQDEIFEKYANYESKTLLSISYLQNFRNAFRSTKIEFWF